MIKVIRTPEITMYPAIRVNKDTKLEFKNKNVNQTIENLVLKSKTKIKGQGYKSTYNTTIELNEGDILIFEDDSRGYIKPVEKFCEIDEAIELLNNIKE